jgi:hypothetical protein
MCFSLYVGTTKPLARRAWAKNPRALSVLSLVERDADIARHFTLPEVQQVGSTAGCGCDFPHVTLTKGEWVGYLDVVVDNPEWEVNERFTREALVALLRESGEMTIELYGIWDGKIKENERIREEVSLSRILDPDFRFKERGFYTVTL